MHSISVGILNCSILKNLDKCVHLLLGHLSTSDQEELEVWANLGEQALRSLRQDLLQPGDGRVGFTVGVGDCCVTGEQTACIRALVATMPEFVNNQPTGREALIHACLSLEGIDRLLAVLAQTTEAPLNLNPLVQAKNNTPYCWIVVHEDGSHVSQFPYEGKENPWRAVRHTEISLLVIEPRDWNTNLPWYRLTAVGFERCVHGGEPEFLPVPVPDEPFIWQHYRRVTVTYFCTDGAGNPLPPRIVQVLGWRVPRSAGDLLCEISVEEDGSWSIYRRGRLLAAPAGETFIPLLEDEFETAMQERKD